MGKKREERKGKNKKREEKRKKVDKRGWKIKYSSIVRRDRPTVKCLIVQANGWTKIDIIFFRIRKSRKNHWKIDCKNRWCPCDHVRKETQQILWKFITDLSKVDPIIDRGTRLTEKRGHFVIFFNRIVEKIREVQIHTYYNM